MFIVIATSFVVDLKFLFTKDFMAEISVVIIVRTVYDALITFYWNQIVINMIVMALLASKLFTLCDMHLRQDLMEFVHSEDPMAMEVTKEDIEASAVYIASNK